MRIRIWLSGVVLLLYTAVATAGAPVHITYVANEGFLVSIEGKKILVDAIFAEGVEGYAKLSPDDRARLEEAKPPFDDVGLVLASHFHYDHFDPVAVGRYLLANTQAMLVTTPDALALMRSKFDLYKDVQGRTRSAMPAEGDSKRFDVDGIDVQVLNVHHGRRFAKDVQNIGFVVSVGERRLLHLGDSAGDDTDFRRNKINEMQFDVAFVPYWYLSNEELVQAARLIDASYIVAMHVPPNTSPGGVVAVTAVLENFPNAIVFERPFEEKTLFPQNSR